MQERLTYLIGIERSRLSHRCRRLRNGRNRRGRLRVTCLIIVMRQGHGLFRRLWGFTRRTSCGIGIGDCCGSFLFPVSLQLFLDEDAVDVKLWEVKAVDLMREVFVALQQNDLIQKAFVLQEV